MNKVAKSTSIPLNDTSRISLFSFDIILMIADYLHNNQMVAFLQAFQHLPAFAPFKYLIKAHEVYGVSKIWPLFIDEELTAEECQIVQDASIFSKTVTFAGQLGPLFDTVKTCNITPFRKVILKLCHTDLTPRYLTQLQELQLNELSIDIKTCDASITGVVLMEALSRMHQLRSLSIHCRHKARFIMGDTLSSIRMMMNLTKLSLSSGKGGFSVTECRAIGRSLRSTKITDLQVGYLCWDGLIVLSAALKNTSITDLVFTHLRERYVKSNCEKFWDNMSYSKVKHLYLSRR